MFTTHEWEQFTAPPTIYIYIYIHGDDAVYGFTHITHDIFGTLGVEEAVPYRPRIGAFYWPDQKAR